MSLHIRLCHSNTSLALRQWGSTGTLPLMGKKLRESSLPCNLGLLIRETGQYEPQGVQVRWGILGPAPTCGAQNRSRGPSGRGGNTTSVTPGSQPPQSAQLGLLVCSKADAGGSSLPGSHPSGLAEPTSGTTPLLHHSIWGKWLPDCCSVSLGLANEGHPQVP